MSPRLDRDYLSPQMNTDETRIRNSASGRSANICVNLWLKFRAVNTAVIDRRYKILLLLRRFFFRLTFYQGDLLDPG